MRAPSLHNRTEGTEDKASLEQQKREKEGEARQREEEEEEEEERELLMFTVQV